MSIRVTVWAPDRLARGGVPWAQRSPEYPPVYCAETCDAQGGLLLMTGAHAPHNPHGVRPQRIILALEPGTKVIVSEEETNGCANGGGML